MIKQFIGLDIGGTKCAVVLARVDKGIQIADKISFATASFNGPEKIIDHLMDTINIILEKNNVKIEQIAAIGISCGGPLDSRRGLILSPPNLPGWHNIPLPRMMSERFGVPAFLQNDANSCALVEWKLGAGKGMSDMIFLTMGTGMGAGVISEGQLLRGHNDMGGEIGHLRLMEEGPVGFGKAGSFEGFTSGGGIAIQAGTFTQELISQEKEPAWIKDGHTADEMDAKLMAEYAKKGNKDAQHFFTGIGKMLGRGLALLVDAFNPQRIIIGSIFVRCEELLRPSMEEELKKEAIPFSLEGLSIVPAQTGEELGDLASIMVALHAMGIDPLRETGERDTLVMAHLDLLIQRYPQLSETRESILKAYITLRDCYESGNKLLVAGNGGSSADSDHIVGELMKGFYLKRPLHKDVYSKLEKAFGEYAPGAVDLLQGALPAISLSSHTALMTAFMNDVDPQLVMAQQVIGYAKPGDALLALSTSGNARNVNIAARTAAALGMHVIGLTGESGGSLKDSCETCIRVPGKMPAEVQELHLPVYHTLCAMLESKFYT